MNSTTAFITSFMAWVGQFVVVSTVILIVTHLIAKKRREQKRRAATLTEAQDDGIEETVESEDAELVKVG
ncbi:MAG: hypothetical protein HQ518_31505 [Rhodopirellula sp.]|nr:hypothetical protein [Rhodopirellula sp.]